MKKLIPRLGLSKLNALGFVQFVSYILQQMTGNVNFPAPTPTLAAITAKAGELKMAITDMDAHVAGAKALRDQLRLELSIMIADLANYCVLTSAGDPSIFLTSGFELRRTPQPAPDPLPPVPNVQLQNVGSDDQLRLNFKPVQYARSYEVWVSAEDEGHFQYRTTISGQRYIIRSLEPGKRYYVKVRAIGPRGIIGGFSDVASRLAAA